MRSLLKIALGIAALVVAFGAGWLVAITGTGQAILSIIIISPGLDSRARTALEHMLESVVSARGKVLRTNFSATSRVTRATKLTQAASRHSYRWCSPPTRGSATTFAVGDGRCVTVLKLGVSLFSPKWQRSS